jgi:hypothetical protein
MPKCDSLNRVIFLGLHFYKEEKNFFVGHADKLLNADQK